MSLWTEINSQPKVLATALENLAAPTQATASWISEMEPSQVLIAARGTSDNAARYAQYVWGARNGLNVGLAAPSLFGAYQAPPRLTDSLVVGISQSGASPDLLNVLADGKRQGRPTLAITNNPDSPMAQLADRSIDIGAGPELAVAATKSYTSQLLTIAMISVGMAGDRSELASIPNDVASALEAVRPEDVDRFRDQNRCVVIGRGYHHATAHEWSLKIAELAYLVAHPFSAADFRHGPMALVEPGLAVLAVATSGVMYDDVRQLIDDISTAGATVATISDRPGDLAIPQCPEWLSPIPAIVAAQVFTYYLTVARGLDPDAPRNLKKVTLTN